MSKFEKIIPLGQTCNITYLLQHSKIKKETSLFEWFVSNNLNHITTIINKIGQDELVNVSQKGEHVCIDDYNIFSGHYKIDEYMPIYLRRRDRFIETIKQNNKILFIRVEINSSNIYKTEDIDRFVESIKRINKNCDEMKLLLIRPDNNGVEHPFVINKCCIGEIPIDIFVNILQEIGYDTMETKDIEFNDKSIN